MTEWEREKMAESIIIGIPIALIIWGLMWLLGLII